MSNGRGFGFQGRGTKQHNSNSGQMTLPPRDWSSVRLTPFLKDFSPQIPAFNKYNQIDVDRFLQAAEITLSGNNFPQPFLNFVDPNFPPNIMFELQRAGFQNPTPIQSQAWSVIMSGRDMIGVAQTGSGKTLAFALPALIHIMAQPPLQRGDGPIALIVCPTRELAQQVQTVVNTFGSLCNIRNVCLYGGSSKRPQAQSLSNGCEIVVATPGRLIDMIYTRATNLNRCTYLVLDEADKMLDMGFEPQIKSIVSHVRPDRQTVMFSATWPEEIRSLAREFLKDPVQINIGKLTLQANHLITQIVQVCREEEKEMKLKELLQSISSQPANKTIIFVDRKKRCDEMARKLKYFGFYTASIHGDKSQDDRDWVIREFKAGRRSILVATDVAARGLDIPDVNFVINLDFPMSVEDYIHRIGRTGRASRTGTAYTFFTSDNSKKAGELVKVLTEAKQNVPRELYDMASRSGYSRPRNGAWRGNRSNTSYRAGKSYYDNRRYDNGSSGRYADRNDRMHSHHRSGHHSSYNRGTAPRYSDKTKVFDRP